VDSGKKRNSVVYSKSYSGGARGAANVQLLHQDIEILLKQARSDLPLFLYGHSMGGLLILSLAMRNPEINFAGIITTSALIGFP
jgi:alpha-beta hydrolase superfamily lysophospholipase